MSFSGCGFMSAYHFGVVEAFHQNGKRLLGQMTYFSGASAGSLIASLLALRRNREDFSNAREELFKVAGEINRRGHIETLKSLLSENIKTAILLLFPQVDWEPYALAEKLREILDGFIPEDTSELLNEGDPKKKLFVSVSRCPTPHNNNPNKIICKFDCKPRLVNALLASCHIPVGEYMGAEPPTIDNEKCFDGGWSNNLPVFDSVPTITVSPFSGPVSIGPDHKEKPGFRKNGQAFYGDFDNLIRGKTALFPAQEELDHYFKEGLKDGKRFLEDNQFNDEHESMHHLEIPDYLK